MRVKNCQKQKLERYAFKKGTPQYKRRFLLKIH
jgi:hypothetical protein